MSGEEFNADKQQNDSPMSVLAKAEPFDANAAEIAKDFRAKQLSGELPYGVRDEQDYREYLGEQNAREDEANAAEREQFAKEDAEIEKVLAEMENEKSEAVITRRTGQPKIITMNGYSDTVINASGDHEERPIGQKYAIWKVFNSYSEEYPKSYQEDEDPDVNIKRGIILDKSEVLQKLWNGTSSIDAQRMESLTSIIESGKWLLNHPDEDSLYEAESAKELAIISMVEEDLKSEEDAYIRYLKRRQDGEKIGEA